MELFAVFLPLFHLRDNISFHCGSINVIEHEMPRNMPLMPDIFQRGVVFLSLFFFS